MTVSMMWMMQQQDRFSGLPCGLSSVNDAGDAALSSAKMRVMQQQEPSVA